MDRIRQVEQQYMKASPPSFAVGDTVDVEVKITEGDKERIQVFNGVVIAFNGASVRRTFTVRRIVQGEGVERVFPIHSPRIAQVRVVKRGVVRRAKLYHLRGRSGKGARIREKISTAAERDAAEREKEDQTPAAEAVAAGRPEPAKA
jgi:large subunit ribosomal protein L19